MTRTAAANRPRLAGRTATAVLGAVLAAAAAASPPVPAAAEGYRNPGADGTWAQRGHANPYTGGAFNSGTGALLDVMRMNRERLRAAGAPPRAASAGPPRASSGVKPEGARPASDDPSFRLVNRESVAVMQLFVSPSQVDNWGPDRLGQGVLGAGQGFVVSLPAGSACVNDVRVVVADGRALERRRVDTCAITDMAVP